MGLLVLMVTVALSFGGDESEISRSNRSRYEASMRLQKTRDELNRPGIADRAKAFIERAKNGETILVSILRSAELNPVDREGRIARRFACRYHHVEAAEIIDRPRGHSDQPGLELFVATQYTDAQGAASNDADASEVIRQVVAAYRSLSSYSDRGTSLVHLAGSDASYRVDFETLFKRPNKLRFAWTLQYSHAPGKQRKNVIWCDGATAWSSYSFRGNKPELKQNLELAVAGAVGPSWTTAHNIPRLLSDEVGGIPLDEQVQGFKITGNETADGVHCVVVVGNLATGGECKIWVGLKDHLIRRIEERSKNGIREEVRTQIVVNQDILDSRFSEKGQ
jgi:outer membrane lipoprotein-sorting protein